MSAILTNPDQLPPLSRRPTDCEVETRAIIGDAWGRWVAARDAIREPDDVVDALAVSAVKRDLEAVHTRRLNAALEAAERRAIEQGGREAVFARAHRDTRLGLEAPYDEDGLVETIETADILRAARDRLGLSQRAMAEAMDIPLRTYESWEGGQEPQHPSLVRLAVAELERRHG